MFPTARAGGGGECGGRRSHARQTGGAVPAAGRQGRGDQPALAARRETEGPDDGAGGTHRLHQVHTIRSI